MHHVDRLLNLVEILFKMMMQVVYRVGVIPLPERMNRVGLVELATQTLQRLAHGGWRI